MNAMQPPQSIEEIKAGLETTEKGGVRQSIRNCLTVFQRDPLLSGAIAYNILTDRKDIIAWACASNEYGGIENDSRRFDHYAVRLPK